MDGHQPYLSEYGLYYCVNNGLNTNGGVKWRVSYNGEIINNGTTIVPNSIVECSPFVEKRPDGIFVMSFVVGFKNGGYSLAIAQSNTHDFKKVISYDLIPQVLIGTIASKGFIFMATAHSEGFMLSKYNNDLNLTSRIQVNLGLKEKYSICKISKIDSSEILLMTFLELSENGDFFTIMFDPVLMKVSEKIKHCGRDIYKSTLYDGKIIYAKKNGDNFENRSLVEFNIQKGNIAWSDAEEAEVEDSRLFNKLDARRIQEFKNL